MNSAQSWLARLSQRILLGLVLGFAMIVVLACPVSAGQGPSGGSGKQAVVTRNVRSTDRKSTRLNSSHYSRSRMPSSA